MREVIVVGNIYHCLSRGVDGRTIFTNDGDYLRFIHNLFEFNDAKSVSNNNYWFNTKSISLRSSYIEQSTKTEPRVLLVQLLAFCLMPNHYHLLLRPLSKGGLTLFMRRLNMGYANYFNVKYERKGALFQGRFKSVAVTNDAHFIHLPYYIHCNPLDLFTPEWREREIKDYKKAFAYLENYRWSSFPDYIGKKNFPSVTQREFLMEFFNGPEEYKRSMFTWLKDMDFGGTSDFILE